MNPMHAMTDLTLLRTRLYSLRPATLALLASGLVTPFLACETQDPRPGLGRDGGMVRTGGRSGSGTGSGGRLDFGGNDTGGLAGGGAEPGATGGSDPSGNGGEGVQTGGADGGGLMTRSCALAPAYPADFSKRALLESAGACSALLACRFSNAALQLGRHVTRYVENPSSQTQTAAQEAWTQAMTIWSRAAPAQYGPVASIGADSYHGRGIGAFIHAWPALNRCEVEKQVVTRAYQAGLDKVLPSARGLSALEYLLFVEGADTVCSANSSTAKAWAQLTPQEIAAAKRDYAQAVAEDLYLKSEELVSVWSPDGENFAETLAGHDGYGSQQEALNVVAWSLLYPYHEVRDLKVAPLAEIGTALPNPATPYARVDRESIAANLMAFRDLFEGCGEDHKGIGFDDWLDAVGADDLREDILKALSGAQAHATRLPPLHEATSEQMAAFYVDLKVLSDLLKEQLFGSGSILNLKLPASAASDTD